MRGGAAPQVLQAPTAGHASELADRVEQALRKHQLRYRRLPLGEASWQIQAKVAPGSEAAAALAREGVSVPPGGLIDLKVVVIAAAPADPAASGEVR